MRGVWIGGRLLCDLALLHRHRVVVVMALHRMLRMLGMVHRRYRHSRCNVTMRQPAAHQRGKQHQQHG